MNDKMNHDMSCVPYKRFWLYFLLTIPLLAIMGFAGYVLWIDWYGYGLIYISFWLLTNIFQSYCCAYQDCPYTGRLCPAVAGIIPASFLGKLLQKMKVKKSKIVFEIFAIFGSLNLLALIVFPLYWLFVYHIVAFVGYLIIIIIYAFAFLLTICPACAIRDTCPGGQASNKLRKVELDTNETEDV